MSILSRIIAGLIAGRLAGLIREGGGYGFIGNLVVGVFGASAGWISGYALVLGGDHFTDFNWQTPFWLHWVDRSC